MAKQRRDENEGSGEAYDAVLPFLPAVKRAETKFIEVRAAPIVLTDEDGTDEAGHHGMACEFKLGIECGDNRTSEAGDGTLPGGLEELFPGICHLREKSATDGWEYNLQARRVPFRPCRVDLYQHYADPKPALVIPTGEVTGAPKAVLAHGTCVVEVRIKAELDNTLWERIRTHAGAVMWATFGYTLDDPFYEPSTDRP